MNTPHTLSIRSQGASKLGNTSTVLCPSAEKRDSLEPQLFERAGLLQTCLHYPWLLSRWGHSSRVTTDPIRAACGVHGQHAALPWQRVPPCPAAG